MQQSIEHHYETVDIYDQKNSFKLMST